MAGFLLSTKALYEFVNGERSPATKFVSWLNGLGDNDAVFASEISLGELRSSVEAISHPPARELWRHYLDRKIPQQFGSRLLPFGSNSVRAWGLVRSIGPHVLPAEESQVVGQAIAHELIFVGPRTPTHSSIGHRHLDPYENEAWPGLTFI